MSALKYGSGPYKTSLIILFCFITISVDAKPLLRAARQTIPGASASITGTSLNYGAEGQYPINTNYGGYQTQQQIPFYETQVPNLGGIGNSWQSGGNYPGVGGGYGYGSTGYGGGYGMGGYGQGSYGVEGYGGADGYGKTGRGTGGLGGQSWKGFGAGKNPYGGDRRYPQQGVKY